VPRVDRDVRRLIADMLVTMRRARGVGLAAPQVGVPWRVLVADPGTGPLALVNPVYRRRWGSQVGPEGCLSIPGTVALIRRAEGVEVAGRNALGRGVVVRATGLLARVLQHEIDHLNGVLILDRAARQGARGAGADGTPHGPGRQRGSRGSVPIPGARPGE
jgi:peptide deformylase